MDQLQKRQERLFNTADLDMDIVDQVNGIAKIRVPTYVQKILVYALNTYY